MAAKVEVENVIRPGSSYRVDAEKYTAVRQAMLEVLPAAPPGPTLAELRELIVARLPEALFPGGAKAGWWIKAVQLDLEAKGIVAREKTTPLRLHRV